MTCAPCLRGSFRPPPLDHLPEQPADPPTRSPASTEQALAAVRLATEAVDNLLLLGAVDQPLAARVTAALARIHARLSAQMREARAGKLRGLYVIIDPAAAPSDPLAVAAAALRAGACAIQWRDKLRDKGDQLPDCLRLLELCDRHDALFIVNDHADLAASCGAHGLHVGQHDLPLPRARQVMAPHQIVGSSNATVEEAVEAHSPGRRLRRRRGHLPHRHQVQHPSSGPRDPPPGAFPGPGVHRRHRRHQRSQRRRRHRCGRRRRGRHQRRGRRQ